MVFSNSIYTEHTFSVLSSLPNKAILYIEKFEFYSYIPARIGLTPLKKDDLETAVSAFFSLVGEKKVLW